MTWLRSAKKTDLDLNLQAAKKRLQRAERRASEAWAAYEETGSTQELSRWNGYADTAQMHLARVARAEALIRIANNG